MRAKVYSGGDLADACGNRDLFTNRLAQLKIDGRRHEVITKDWHLDGELVGKQFHAFDVLSVGALDVTNLAQVDRLRMIDRLDLEAAGILRVPWSLDCRALARYADAEGHEGIVTKLIGQRYGAGCWLKFKRQVTHDVVVTAMHDNGVASVTLDGEDAGKVQHVPESVRVGDVIEVVAMEVTKRGCLRHGRFYRARPDKSAVHLNATSPQ